ncbi:hypothetical protein WG954_15155 [Lacibacter sp. H375]|uniref:hypothetical protein n=1 Tax=Lacibacter sp. H375 TaxID=3133424 RepID=UPI0030C2AAB2
MDNPRKKKEDSKRVSSKQPHEQAYQKKKEARKDKSNSSTYEGRIGMEPNSRSARSNNR